MPRKKAQFGAGAVNVPGYPSNVRLTPQAVAQLQAQQGQQSVNPVLQQFNAPQPQQQQQPVTGPLAGLAQPQGGFYPQQQGNFFPQQQPVNAGQMPSLNQQSTAIPQGQVIHPTGKQRGSTGRAIMGTRPQIYNNPLYTDYQNSVLNYLTQFGLGGLQNLNQNQFDFAPIGNQELERFYTQTIPSIAERFTAMGDGQRSSAFQGALGNAGRFLSNDLAAQQQQYGLQQQGMNQNLYTNLLSLGLRPQFESNLNPGKSGALPGIVNAGAKLLGTALTGGF